MTNFTMGNSELGLGGKTFKIHFSNDRDLVVFCCCEAHIKHQTFAVLQVLESEIDEISADEITVTEVIRNDEGGFNLYPADEEVTKVIIATLTDDSNDEEDNPSYLN